jgi:hypothetical protein
VSFVFCLFYSTGVWTQSFVLARQALSSWPTPPRSEFWVKMWIKESPCSF